MLSVFAFAVLILSHSLGTAIASPGIYNAGSDAASVVSPLDVFQVQAPLRASYEGASCQQVIVQHNFAGSYGTPFVGNNFSDMRHELNS